MKTRCLSLPVFLLSLFTLSTAPHALAATVTWGGKGIELTQTGKKVSYRLDCGRGSSGNFMIKKKKISGIGTQVRESGGPTRPDAPDFEPVPVRFSGTVEGNSMTLKISPAGIGGSGKTYQLKKGAVGELRRCL